MRLTPLMVLAPDFEDESGKLWVVLEPITYETSKLFGWRVTVPKGFKTDLASLPPLTRFLVRQRGHLHKINSGAILHDYLYATHGCSRGQADLICEGEWRGDGVPRWEAKLFRSTIQMFGKHAYKTGPERLAANCPDLKIEIGRPPEFENLNQV